MLAFTREAGDSFCPGCAQRECPDDLSARAGFAMSVANERQEHGNGALLSPVAPDIQQQASGMKR